MSDDAVTKVSQAAMRWLQVDANSAASNLLQTIGQVVRNAPFEVYDFLVREPIRRLWLRGPWLGGYGFWNGRDSAYICAHLSTLSTVSILERPQDCHELIERQFDSFMVACEFVLYVLFVYVVLRVIAAVAMFRLSKWINASR